MQPLEPQPAIETPVEPARIPWYQRLGTLLFVIVCFEVGIFLMIFPWMEYWDQNWIAGIAPWVRAVWNSPFFRGALSGLGVLNIYISLVEIIRLRRPPADRLKVSAL